MSDNREDIAYKSDFSEDRLAVVPQEAVSGEIVQFGSGRELVGSGKAVSDFVEMSEVNEAVSGAASEIWDAIRNEFAIAAYVAPSWAPSTSYAVGTFCMHGGKGYRCNAAHTSSAVFNSSKWDLVLSASGKSALDDLVAAYEESAGSALLDMAPEYSPDAIYYVNQLVIKDGKLQMCTSNGAHGRNSTFSDDATIEESIANRIASVLSAMPTKTSELTNDSGFITAGDVPTKTSELTNDSGFITEEDVPTKTSELTNDSGFITAEDVPTKTSELTNDSGFITAGDVPTKTSDLQNDSGFITEEDVPTKVSELENDSGFAYGTSIDSEFSSARTGGYSVGETCTRGGRLYKCVHAVSEGSSWSDGDWTEISVLARAGDIASAKMRYDIQNLVYTLSNDDSEIVFQLHDRAVNVISNVTVSGNQKIELVLPPAAMSGDEIMSRDFLVVFNVDSDHDAIVHLRNASLEDSAGNSVTLYAQPSKAITYRFTETATSGSVFLVTGFADPAINAIREIERALDDILADGGVWDFVPGAFLYDETTDKYHKISIRTDPETGEADIGVEQEGITK